MARLSCLKVFEEGGEARLKSFVCGSCRDASVREMWGCHGRLHYPGVFIDSSQHCDLGRKSLRRFYPDRNNAFKLQIEIILGFLIEPSAATIPSQTRNFLKRLVQMKHTCK